MQDRSPFSKFIYLQDRASITNLLEAGSDINGFDSHGWAPLLHAVVAEHASAEFVEWLIGEGADVNVREKGKRWSPLHFAASEQKLDLVEALISKGAQVDAEDIYGNTPLAECISHSSQSSPTSKIAQALIEAGANIKKKNANGISPLDLAVEMEMFDIVDLLKKFSGQ